MPSNLGLERFGARKWIARIMLTWGIVSGAFALIGGPTSFLVLRFMLGAAEAGFFPGAILYLTYWFPAVYRAKIVGLFMVAIPVARLIGSPISGAILGMDGVLGLGGWQWIFILEAIPTLILGVAAFYWLTDRPEHAPWLPAQQQQWPIARLAAEKRRETKVTHQSVWKTMTNKYVLIMALVYAGAAGASTSLALWLPALVKSFGMTNFQTGLVNSIPLGIAAGTYASKGPFWTLSSEWLGATTAGAGLAQINALGNLSGFFFNYMIGWIKDETGSFPLAIMPIALVATIGTICILTIGRKQPRTVAIPA